MDRQERSGDCSELPSGHLFERFRRWPIKDRWRCTCCGFVTRHYDSLDGRMTRPIHNHMSVAMKGVNTV